MPMPMPMPRQTEPELMDDAEQAAAYDAADFSASHSARVELFRARFNRELTGAVLDLGCGSGDVLERFAKAYPAATFTGIDGAPAMLDLASERMRNSGLNHRVNFAEAYIPSPDILENDYKVVMSHSLLHHLHEPKVLWQTIKHHAKSGAFIFVADLRRPESEDAAQHLVDTLSGNEPDVLRRDFYNSLLAAFTVDEIKAQLADADLELTVEEAGDVHVLVYGWRNNR